MYTKGAAEGRCSWQYLGAVPDAYGEYVAVYGSDSL
jgi:hypothetical protein